MIQIIKSSSITGTFEGNVSPFPPDYNDALDSGVPYFGSIAPASGITVKTHDSPFTGLH